MSDPYVNKNNAPFINARERFIPRKSLEPKADELVSQIVGKRILMLDPRLMKLVVKWKRGKPQDSMENDDFLKDPAKIAELREVFKNG